MEHERDKSFDRHLVLYRWAYGVVIHQIISRKFEVSSTFSLIPTRPYYPLIIPRERAVMALEVLCMKHTAFHLPSTALHCSSSVLPFRFMMPEGRLTLIAIICTLVSVINFDNLMSTLEEERETRLA